MSQLTREECIELGLSVPASALVVWATVQLAVARGSRERLGRRGITAPFLREIKTLIGRVAELENTLGKEKASLQPELARSRQIREEALAYWREALQIVKIEFGQFPEIQARCRLGIRTGRLLANLCREMECVVAVLREHSPVLSRLGVDEAFLSAGDAQLGKLKEAQARLDSTLQALSPDLAEQCTQEGKLYDLTRKLVRIGRLEFLHEPEQASAFNYSQLRRELRADSEVRVTTVKADVR
jgi:hypothetical protein